MNKKIIIYLKKKEDIVRVKNEVFFYVQYNICIYACRAFISCERYLLSLPKWFLTPCEVNTNFQPHQKTEVSMHKYEQIQY